ncbi:MAG: oxidative damage protection protein [Steroidobacteraceae bacterium]
MTEGSTRMVQCAVLKREAPGLVRPVYPGELGVRIWREVSQEGWQRWVAHQTMLINEYRLVPIEPKARQFLEAEMQKFLFGEGASRPEGYVPPS